MRRIPQPLPELPKVDRETGVVKSRGAQHVLAWAHGACAALHEQAPIVERNAKKFMRGAGSGELGAGGRTYADDGTLPGPTPAMALRTDHEARYCAMYAAALGKLLAALLELAYTGDQFMVMGAERAAKKVAEERGGVDCKRCGEWVAQEGNDWIRGGLCMRCYQQDRRAEDSE